MGEAIEQALREATASLAECFRLSGADPDGDSDSMLAKFAVEEVGRLRREYDEMEDQVLALRSKLEEEVQAIQDCDVTNGKGLAGRIQTILDETKGEG